jgi:hypothetical protein
MNNVALASALLSRGRAEHPAFPRRLHGILAERMPALDSATGLLVALVLGVSFAAQGLGILLGGAWVAPWKES